MLALLATVGSPCLRTQPNTTQPSGEFTGTRGLGTADGSSPMVPNNSDTTDVVPTVGAIAVGSAGGDGHTL